MNHLKEEHDEQSTVEGSFSPKSLPSGSSLDGEDSPRNEIVEFLEEGEVIFSRVMDWFAERKIERGDPNTILDQYLQQKR